MKRVSSFKQWLYFTESVEENFDEWLESIKSYAKPNEAALRTIQIGPNQKKLIIDVLKEKRKEIEEVQPTWYDRILKRNPQVRCELK